MTDTSTETPAYDGVDYRPQIKPEVRDWWADELESGRYGQLREALVDGWVEDDKGGHAAMACCLGVLAGVAIEHGCKDVRWNPDKDGSVQTFNGDGYDAALQRNNGYAVNDEDFWIDYTDGNLPEPVAEWAFVGPVDRHSSGNPSLTADGLAAIHLNDEAKKTFPEIAALVRDMPVPAADEVGE